MAAIVQIDQPVTTVAVRAGERQTIAFDIVNVAGRTLNVVATGVPGDGGAVPGWITVDGERTLRLGPNETRKVALGLAPPATAPAGELPVRLKVYEVSMPEENNGFSETVTVTVTPAPPAPPKRPWKAIAAIAAVLALLVAGGGWLAYDQLTRQYMPAVEGQSLADAQQALAERGVPADRISITHTIDPNADGTVTDQSPAADTPLDDEVGITLTVPRLPVMPDLAGMTLDEANMALEEAGVDPTTVAIGRAPGRQSGRMVAQEPAAGTELAPGTEVSLKLSALIMQLVEGATLEGARAHLEEAGFSWSVVTVERPISLDAGDLITSQTPGPGVVMGQNSPITLVVPRLPEMPDVTGHLPTRARAMLRRAGIPDELVTVESPLDPRADGGVSRQTPEPGASVGANSAVVLTAPRQPATLTLARLDPAATADDARRIYQAQGLTVEIIEDRDAPGRVPGRVIEVLPPPGSAVEETAAIEVRVQSSTVSVPNFAGHVITDAQRRHVRQYFDLAESKRSWPGGADCVLEQSNNGNLRRGSSITITTADPKGYATLTWLCLVPVEYP